MSQLRLENWVIGMRGMRCLNACPVSSRISCLPDFIQFLHLGVVRETQLKTLSNSLIHGVRQVAAGLNSSRTKLLYNFTGR